MISPLLFTLALVSAGPPKVNFTLNFLPSPAVCLDGSPAAYYFRPSSSNSSRWVISLEGGGECTTDADCLARSTTKRGSSKSYISFDADITGPFYSNSKTANPDFAAANQVVLKYCSGDLYSGSSSSSSSDLQFRGYDMVRALLAELQKNTKINSASIIYRSSCCWILLAN